MIIRTNIFGLNHNNFNKGFANWILNNFKKKKLVRTYKNYFFHPINACFWG